GIAPEHRASDLMVVTLDLSKCPGSKPVTLRVSYDADGPGHDLSSELTLARPVAGLEPTRVYVPVFSMGSLDETFLKFSGVSVEGAPLSCVERVARVTSGASLPLWIEMQVPGGDRSDQHWYQAIELPGLAGWAW